MKSTRTTMRLLHRYIGYFMAGIMAVYAISGVLLIYRDTDFLKKEKKIEKKLEDRNTERHEALMKAIADNKADTDKKFEKIKVVMFFSENPKWLYLIIIGVAIMILFTNVGDLIKLIK